MDTFRWKHPESVAQTLSSKNKISKCSQVSVAFWARRNSGGGRVHVTWGERWINISPKWQDVHHGRLAWNLRIQVWKRRIIWTKALFLGSMLMEEIPNNHLGCIEPYALWILGYLLHQLVVDVWTINSMQHTFLLLDPTQKDLKIDDVDFCWTTVP